MIKGIGVVDVVNSLPLNYLMRPVMLVLCYIN